jgi:hypothetical protein
LTKTGRAPTRQSLTLPAMGIPDEKTPAELEKGSDDDAMMYTGRVDAREYGTLKREYVA